jgi:hypothetical protein
MRARVGAFTWANPRRSTNCSRASKDILARACLFTEQLVHKGTWKAREKTLVRLSYSGCESPTINVRSSWQRKLAESIDEVSINFDSTKYPPTKCRGKLQNSSTAIQAGGGPKLITCAPTNPAVKKMAKDARTRYLRVVMSEPTKCICHESIIHSGVHDALAFAVRGRVLGEAHE